MKLKKLKDDTFGCSVHSAMDLAVKKLLSFNFFNFINFFNFPQK